MSKQQPELTGARWLSIWARLSALALLPMLAGYAGGWHWLLDLCAHFRWQYAVVLALGGLPALLLRRRRLAAAFLAGSILNGWSLANATGPAMEAGADQPVGNCVNLEIAGRQRPCRPDRRASPAGPDRAGVARRHRHHRIVADVSQALAGTRRPLPDPSLAAARRPFRHWIVDAAARGGDRNPEHAATRVSVPGAALGRTAAFQPVAGTSVPADFSRSAGWRDQQLAHITGRVGRDPQVLVAGDFNATPWSQAYRSFRRNTELQDSSAATLPWPTWFGGSAVASVLAVPIDHVLHGKGWRVVERRIGPDIGSDHRPLIVSFAARQ